MAILRPAARYIAKRTGEIQSPCGVPMSKSKSTDVAESHLYRVVLPLKYDSKILISERLNPKRPSIKAHPLCERDGKNCAMSNAQAVECRPSSLDSATKEANVTPASMVACLMMPPHWPGCSMSYLRQSNCMRAAIIFVRSLPIVLSRLMGLNAFGTLYLGLFGLGMMMQVDCLNHEGQTPLARTWLNR